MQRVLKLGDGLAGARELGGRWVFAGEAARVGLDHVEVRLGIKSLAELDCQVDIGLLLHEQICDGLLFSLFLVLCLAG